MANMEGYGSDPTLPAIANITATMDGIFGLVENPDAVPPVEPDYGIRTTQRDFLNRALSQAEQLEYAPRTVRGPHHAVFNDFNRGVNENLHRIDPSLTPDYLAPPGYRNYEVFDYIDSHPRKSLKLDALRESRVRGLCAIGRDLAPEIRNQELPPGLLDVPQYHRQGEHADSETARQLCVNACFRMVYHDIAGWAPDEDILADQMTERHGGIVMSDDEYFKIFQTEAFKGVSGRTIKVVEVLGADFATINKLTTGVKQRHPDAKVFAMVSLGSETALNKDTWHANILLHADRDDVMCRDPAIRAGSSRRLMYTQLFLQRWAIAYNRVQMIIAI